MTTATFNYGDPATYRAGEKPWAKVDSEATSYGLTSRTRPVHDIRTVAKDSIGVDVSGFDFLRAPASETAFTDQAAIQNGYYAEVEKMLRDRLSTPAEPVRRVVFFDHTVRRRDPQAPRQPVQRVHVDQTPAAAEARVRRHVPDKEDAESLLRGRYQIINVWRPIGHPASDHPLALVDWRSTDPDDLVAVDLLYPNRPPDDDDDDRGKEVTPDPAKLYSTEGYTVRGETYTVKPNEKHKFHYAKDMTPEEVLLIKCYDSRSAVQPNGRPGVAAYTPHTAFDDPNTPPGAKGRQSIEVRCLVFYGEEDK